jgi:Fe-S cluster assembly protein SufD
VNGELAPFVRSMRDAAASLRLPGSGLAWLDAARHEAMRNFLERGLPDARNELWKYTALRALQQRDFAAMDDAAGTRAIADELLRLDGVDGPRVVFVNGVFRADLSRLDDLQDGVSLASLASELRENPEPLRFLFGAHAGRADEDGFMLLNRALATDGLIVRVADGVRVTRPLRVLHIGTAADAAIAWHLRSVVELGRGAGLQLIEQHLGEAGTGDFCNHVHTAILHEGARLGWTIVQRASPQATLLRHSECVLQEDARMDFHALELGGKLARHELRVDLAGARARFDARGACVLRGRQHADTELLVTHRARDTLSDALWRGVAGDRARGVVHGRIHVMAGADGADGSFYNKNLLLSQGAEIDTRPALEIHADEVKANHGATVGQLDENALFYLRARGVPADVARGMLVRAFCATALEGIKPAPLREHCEALLDEQLPEACA